MNYVLSKGRLYFSMLKLICFAEKYGHQCQKWYIFCVENISGIIIAVIICDVMIIAATVTMVALANTLTWGCDI